MAAILSIACLTGCPTRPTPQSGPSGQLPSPLHEGRPYDIASGESLLTIRVFRGGPLAKVGHNHVIASHTLHGTFYVPVDPARVTFEVYLPVTELTIDEAPLRAQEQSDDFPPEIPDSAKEGTRKNMLSPALLDAERYPDILLQAERLEPAPHGVPGDWLAHVRVTAHGRVSSVQVPVHYAPGDGDSMVMSGEFPLKQTDLGLTPFSALLGALQVVDEMKVRFHIVARPSPTRATR